MSGSTAGGEINPVVHVTEKEAIAMGLIPKPASFTQEAARAATPRKRKRSAVKTARAEKGTERLRLARAEIERRSKSETAIARVKAEEEKTKRLALRNKIKEQNRARAAAQRKETAKRRRRRNIGLATKRAQRTGYHFTHNVLSHLAASPSERRAAIKRKTALR